MPKIFISYRRDDSQHQAARLHDALKRHVRDPRRDIFIDVDNIPVGVDFVQHLDAKVAECDVLLALIGPGWLKAGASLMGKRRLDDPEDFVHIEIASALKRGIPVAPILLDGAPMPKESELPNDLKPLARRQGVQLRHETFSTDAERLVRGLNLKEIGKAPRATAVQSKPTSGRNGWIAPVIAIVLMALAGGGTWLWLEDPLGWNTAVPEDTATPDNGAAVAASDPGSASPASIAPSAPPPSVAQPSAGGQPTPRSVVAVSQPPVATDGKREVTPLPPPSAKPVATDPPGAVRTLRVVPERTLLVPLKFLNEPVVPDELADIAALKSAAFSPDGSQIVTTVGFGPICIWDVRTGEKVRSFSRKVSDRNLPAALRTTEHPYGADQAVFSPDGVRILTASVDGADVWEARTGKNLLALTAHTAAVLRATFSSDGSRIVTASADETGRVWDARTGEILLTFSESDS